jgi:hypothetical protein
MIYCMGVNYTVESRALQGGGKENQTHHQQEAPGLLYDAGVANAADIFTLRCNLTKATLHIYGECRLLHTRHILLGSACPFNRVSQDFHHRLND